MTVPGPAYDVSMIETFVVEVWEHPKFLFREVVRGYDLDEVRPRIQAIKDTFKTTGEAKRLLRVLWPYNSVCESLS